MGELMQRRRKIQITGQIKVFAHITTGANRAMGFGTLLRYHSTFRMAHIRHKKSSTPLLRGRIEKF